MTASGKTAAVACALALLSGTARAAEACGELWEAASGPLPGGIGPADFGAIPEACPGRDLTLRSRTALLVASASPDFYGSIISGAMVRVRRPIGAGGWLSFALDVYDFRYVNNGGLASTSSSAGPPTVAYYQRLLAAPTVTAAGYVRVLVPLDTARQNGVETGLEMGGSVRARVAARATIDGGLALTAPFDLIAGRVYAHLQPVALAEVWYALRPAIALAAGASAKVELAPTPTFITAVPRLTARFALRHRLWLAALVEVPVLGQDRTDLIGSLFAGYSP